LAISVSLKKFIFGGLFPKSIWFGFLFGHLEAQWVSVAPARYQRHISPICAWLIFIVGARPSLEWSSSPVFTFLFSFYLTLQTGMHFPPIKVEGDVGKNCSIFFLNI